MAIQDVVRLYKRDRRQSAFLQIAIEFRKSLNIVLQIGRHDGLGILKWIADVTVMLINPAGGVKSFAVILPGNARGRKFVADGGNRRWSHAVGLVRAQGAIAEIRR